MFNISELKDEQLVSDLAPFVKEYAPDYVPLIERLLQHKDVDTREINKMMNAMIEKLVPYYERDGMMSDPKMAHIHNMLVALGRQL
jgi:hypothetical protein